LIDCKLITITNRNKNKYIDNIGGLRSTTNDGILSRAPSQDLLLEDEIQWKIILSHKFSARNGSAPPSETGDDESLVGRLLMHRIARWLSWLKCAQVQALHAIRFCRVNNGGCSRQESEWKRARARERERKRTSERATSRRCIASWSSLLPISIKICELY